MVFTIMAVLNATCYRLRIYSRALDLRLYLSTEDTPGGGLDRLCRLPPTLFVSLRRFEMEKTMRLSWYPAGYDEAVFHRIERVVWDGTLRSSYCRYSWDDGSFLEYPANGTYHA